MKSELKQRRGALLLLGVASFYFLSIDVLADIALSGRLADRWFFPVRAAYLLFMSAGFLSFAPLSGILFSNARRTAAWTAVSSILLLISAFVRFPLLLILLVLADLFIAGLTGAAAYTAAARTIKDCKHAGTLCALGMGIGSFLQIAASVAGLPLGSYAFLLSLSLMLTVFMILRHHQTGGGKPAGESVAPGNTPPILHASMKEYPSLPAFLLCVVLIAFMGGLNDGELSRYQAEGLLDLQAAPRLLYFAGMAIAGFVFDRKKMSGLSALVLFVMICSAAGAIFMSDPATLPINAGIYSLFAGVAIIFFTVPLFLASTQKNDAVLPSLGRAVRLPALAAGMLLYEYVLKRFPFLYTEIIYVLLAAVLALLFIRSGLTSGDTFGLLPGDTETPEKIAVFSAAPSQEIPEALRIRLFSERYGLSAREQEILSAILHSDLPTTLLAGELHVGERTLYRHLSSLYEKTGTDSRVGLLMKYYNFTKTS